MNDFKFFRGCDVDIIEMEFANIFPLISRIVARTVDLDLVSVQPLGAPIGILSFMDFRINKTSYIKISNFKFLKK